jgi:nicotinamide mononucleotide transporter
VNGLESAAVAFGIISVFLSVRQNIWSWPTAIVNVLLYVVVFRDAKLYADMGLQVVYFALSLYGWYEWLHGRANRTELKVSRATGRLWLAVTAIAVGVVAVLGNVLSQQTDAALPFVDSATTATSLVAQWMMTRKVLENWAVWMAVDVVYVGMFIFKKLYLTAGLYAVFFILAAMGYAEWKRSYDADRTAAVPADPQAA